MGTCDLNLFCFLLFSDILNELLQRENRVLHFWTMRKRRLDQCQQYVVFERSAKQVQETHKHTHTYIYLTDTCVAEAEVEEVLRPLLVLQNNV